MGTQPWTYAWEEESSDWVVWGVVTEPDADGMTCQPAICTLSDSCGEEEARLIAAAPDLLEALRSSLGTMNEQRRRFIRYGKAHVKLDEAIAGAEAAIARATRPSGDEGAGS